MNGDTQVVPFGKYKGRPVEALAQDRAYCEWLMAQDWFRARFATIHTLIVNNFGAPSETPEHNLLQARFLETEWVSRFLTVRAVGAPTEMFDATWRRVCDECRHRLIDARRSMASHRKQLDAYPTDEWTQRALDRAEQLEQLLLSDWARVVQAAEGKSASTVRWTDLDTTFEEKGVDVVVRGRAYFDPPPIRLLRPDGNHVQFDGFGFRYTVECKPLLGDDYPGVLRQMRASDADTLLIEDCAAVVPLEQIRAIFAPIRVLTRQEVDDATPLSVRLNWFVHEEEGEPQ